MVIQHRTQSPADTVNSFVNAPVPFVHTFGGVQGFKIPVENKVISTCGGESPQHRTATKENDVKGTNL